MKSFNCRNLIFRFFAVFRLVIRICVISYWIFKIFGPASARSYKIGVVGNNWLVGNTFFSETALRIFLIFCMKLGDCKGRKVTDGFLKKILHLQIFRKGLQISPNSDTSIFFSKTALTIFLVFGLKLLVNMTFNLNETYFSEKFEFNLEIVKISPKLRFLAIFSTLHH